MATSHYFNGRTIKLPGAYSMIKAVASASFDVASYNKCLIVNTDPNYAFGGNVDGKYTKQGDALYSFRSLNEARSFVKAGYPWLIVEALFRPSSLEDRQGISQLYWINALKTISPATMKITAGSGSMTIGIKDECVWANGEWKDSADTGDENPAEDLKKGYALEVAKSTRKSGFVVRVYQGSYKGSWDYDASVNPYGDSLPFDGVDAADARPELVFESPVMSKLSEFKAWADKNDVFNAGFVIEEGWTEGDLSAQIVLASGAEAEYAADYLEEVFDVIRKGDYSVILGLQKNDVTGAAEIYSRMQAFCQSEAKYSKYLAIPGQATKSVTDVEANQEAARGYNSERVWLSTDAPRKSASYAPQGYRTFDTVYGMALIVGRILGLEPQIPGTFKELDIDGIDIPLTDVQLEDCLDAGVLALHWDDELALYTIVRAINTLQNNTALQNEDGSTFSIQISRICTQLNTDLAINAKVALFSSNNGANRFTVNEKSLKNWVSSFLDSKVATPQQDNLIVGWSDVGISRDGDAYYVSYKFNPNSEIAFAFFTGFAIYE